MSLEEDFEQVRKELVAELLSRHGMPENEKIHIVHEGSVDEFYLNEFADYLFQPKSAVVMFIPIGGDWIDGQCYDKQGSKL